MNVATSLVSELIRVANSTQRLSAAQVARLLEQFSEAVRRLRKKTNIVPIPGRDALTYLSTVAAGAGRLPREEWQLHCCTPRKWIRDLNVVLESGTAIGVKERCEPVQTRESAARSTGGSPENVDLPCGFESPPDA
ncbi:hypothetical protein [Rhizobium lentis]|uniref:Uncharacterized protein n=1 Tax=Rhizobium lentis TaxID=1138194 RepID=A0ABS7IDC1_9HYPH|nr:hypothetical protein [Rhizobium lentis]MBX5088321.1 hypothetical protein [Rhizobium lentis]